MCVCVPACVCVYVCVCVCACVFAYMGVRESIIMNNCVYYKYYVLCFLSVDNGNDLSLDDNYFFRAKVHHDGWVEWQPFFKWITSCDLVLTYFPIDEQVCSIKVMNWVYGENLVNLTLNSDPERPVIDTSHFVRSSNWNLVKANASVDNTHFSIPVITFTFELRRDSTYFIVNVLVPTLCLSVLSLLVFKLPPQAGEKMSLSVTLLMSYSVVLMLISDNLPRSDRLPIIS